MLQSLLFIILSVFVLLCFLLYFFQPGFIYFPYKELTATPKDAGLKYEEIILTTEDNVEINGWFVPHHNPRATLLFLHGNGGNISHRLEKLSMYNYLGLAVFIIDYRGYGNSNGKPTERGTYLDAEAAWIYLIQQKNLPENSIIIYGESLGGAVAVWLANKYKPGALVLESAFTSIVDMARHYYPYLPVKLLARIKYSTIEQISNINCPVLIIHSPADDIVPFEQGLKLYDTASEPKYFLEIQGNHNDGFSLSGKLYIDGLDRFISTQFGQ
jgi:uncharacterized protein